MFARKGLVFLWAMLVVTQACCSTSAPPESQREPDPPAQEVSADLEPFLTSYFASWSRGDMAEYRSHFHETAVIMLAQEGDIHSVKRLDRFIEEQSSMQADAASRAEERMTGFEAHEDDVAATVTVTWVLERGPQRQEGVDRFTLLRDANGRWKIVALLFYSTDRR